MIDPELQKIIDKAFIHEECSERRARSNWRKEQLTKRLIAYLEEKLNVESSLAEIGTRIPETTSGRVLQ